MGFGMLCLCVFIATIEIVFTASHAGINETCEQTSDCYATLVAANFECVGQDIYTATSCNMGRCLCPHTHIMRQDSFPPLCVLKKLELENCNNQYECGAGLACQLTEYGLTKCLPFTRLGESCSADEDCAYDSDGRADGRVCQVTCQCHPGLITEGDKCRRPRVGEPCSDSKPASRCNSTMLGDPSVVMETCQNGTCTCPSTAEEVTVVINGHEKVFCVTKYEGTKKGDGEPCSTHNMYSSNFCGDCPGSSNVCLRQKVMETTTIRPSTEQLSTKHMSTATNTQPAGSTAKSTDGNGDVTSARVSATGGFTDDDVNGASQTSPMCVLIVVLWMILM